MGVKTVTAYTCDAPTCGQPIVVENGARWVDAQVYGAVFHLGCWNSMKPHEMAQVLGLDDIRPREGEDVLPGRVWTAFAFSH